MAVLTPERLEAEHFEQDDLWGWAHGFFAMREDDLETVLQRIEGAVSEASGAQIVCEVEDNRQELQDQIGPERCLAIWKEAIR